MEKYSIFGELLYIGFVCEKGRCKSTGLWKWGYKKVLYKHIVLLKQMIQCMLVSEITDDDVSILKKLIELIQTEEDIGRYYPIDGETIKKLQDCNFLIVKTIDSNRNNNSVNLLMNDITTEILENLSNGIIVNKKKITMLIKAIHNLPRVYLGNDTQTICNINQPSIGYKDAIEYSFSYMDKDTKQKYIKYYQ